MKHLIFLLIALINIFPQNSLAQDKEPPYIKGEVKINKTKKPVQNLEIRITKVKLLPKSKMILSEEEFVTLKTDKKGEYKTNIEYGNIYAVYIKKDNYTREYYIVDATLIPPTAKIPELENGAGQESFLFEYNEFKEAGMPMDTAYYQRYPNAYIKFSVQKDEFIGDEAYKKMFMTGAYKDQAWEKEQKRKAAEKKAEEEKKKAEAELAKKNRKRFFSAKLLIKGNTPLPKTKVLLYKEDPSKNPNAQPIESAFTNAYGKFTFKELKTDEAYFLAIENLDESLAPNIKVKNKSGSASLTELPPTIATGTNGKMGLISFTANEEVFKNFEVSNKTILVAGNILVGDKDKTPLANVSVLLKDASEKVIQKTKTNALGGFAFTNINPDEKYILAVEDADPALVANKKVSIVNKAGQEVYSSVADANGKFKFEILPEDKVHLEMMESDESELSINIKGKIYTDPKVKTPLKNSKIYLYDQNGRAVKNTVTDAEGTFVFENIAADVAYLINLDENDPSLKTVTKVYLENDDGSLVKEITKDNMNKFTFEVLQSDFTYLQKVEIEDPWLDIIKNKSTTTTIAEPIYFKAGDDHILGEASTVLNKVALIMKAKPTLKIEVGSHSDATGSDAFNMELSKKRAKAAVDYLVSKGVNPNNLKGVGYGETKLKNNCGNNVKCTEAEHSQNRRIEFKILAQ